MDMLRPLDLLLFSGGDSVSAFIKFVEYRTLTDRSGKLVKPGEFTHVGIVVTSEILEHPNVLPGKYYVMESTMSGKYGQKLGNIDNMTNMCGGFLGVQVRDFDELLPRYLKNSGTKVAVSHLINNPVDDPATNMVLLKRKFTLIYDNYNGITYDANCCSLAAAAFPFMRPFRSEIECLMGTKDWLFCSELVAQVYCDLCILDKVNVKNVLPMDFVGYEEDKHGVRGICTIPVTYLSLK